MHFNLINTGCAHLYINLSTNLCRRNMKEVKRCDLFSQIRSSPQDKTLVLCVRGAPCCLAGSVLAGVRSLIPFAVVTKVHLVSSWASSFCAKPRGALLPL